VNLVRAQNISVQLGQRHLLREAQFSLDSGERVALIGRNGAGKSTLLKVIAGFQYADDGTIWVREGARVAELPQDPQWVEPRQVFDAVLDGVPALRGSISRWHELTMLLAHAVSENETLLPELAKVQAMLEAQGGFDLALRIEEILSRLGLDGSSDVTALSGGAQRRVWLARALISNPDVLLLDEPTNHLDVGGIEWLQTYLQSFSGGVILVTHDRAFLKATATRIVELDRGQLTSWPGDYENYVRRREEREHAETQDHAQFDRELAEEESWIRQGVKARRTRNMGRVRRLIAMREERKQRMDAVGRVALQMQVGAASGKLVFEAKSLQLQLGGKWIVRDFSTRVERGDRIGLIGPNGIGKTTLLRLLLGESLPQSGSVVRGSRVEVGYFDQHRGELNPEWTALENLCEGSDHLEVGGRQMHGISYLDRFLFTADRARTPVKALSGGERNRLTLARLLARPTNVLVMDEPTNDLDLETLEVLEDALLDYEGTLLLVSHDRAFVDAVVTSVWLFEGDGVVHEYIGGYQEAMAQAQARSKKARGAAPVTMDARPQKASSREAAAAKGSKLSYREQQELESLPERIEQMELELARTQQRITEPEFYRLPPDQMHAALKEVDALQAALDVAMDRWALLESRQPQRGV